MPVTTAKGHPAVNIKPAPVFLASNSPRTKQHKQTHILPTILCATYAPLRVTFLLITSRITGERVHTSASEVWSHMARDRGILA